MPNSDFARVWSFLGQLGRKVHDFDNDTLKIMLSNATPDAGMVLKSEITEIGTTGGYTAGGYALANVTWTQAGAIANLDADDLTITATGANIGPFRYVWLYNDTPTSPLDPLIGWWDYGSEYEIAPGDPLLISFSPHILSLT